MPSRTRMTSPVKEVVPAEEKEFVHERHDFKYGDKVKVLEKPRRTVKNWASSWQNGMDATIGSTGLVLESRQEGVKVQFRNAVSWWYPSCALERVLPKKRVRVGSGPWDQAPCTHLRWQLMGFFREKLVIVKTEGGPAEVKVKCTKCKTEMTLKAQ